MLRQSESQDADGAVRARYGPLESLLRTGLTEQILRTLLRLTHGTVQQPSNRRPFYNVIYCPGQLV